MSSWFKSKERTLPVVARCPRKCADRNHSRVIVVTQQEVGITPEIARAAQLAPDLEVLFCRECGCVWRKTFDPHLARFDDQILGTFKKESASQSGIPQLLPEPRIHRPNVLSV